MLLSIKVTALAGDDLDQFRLPLLLNAYFSFRAKCWLMGGGGGQFPRKLN